MTPVVEAKGARIPLVGLGTWDLRGRTCARVVEQALRLGYRHIDTAEMYDNEREVGEGLRASGVPRNEVFVATKVWPSHFAPRELVRAAKESLVKLRLSEVDLLLLHWPNPQMPLSETLGALCKVKEAGMARHIGVSNFNIALLDEATCAVDRAAGLQPVRDASVPRPVEARRRVPCERHGGRGLQPDRARQRQERRGARPHRQGARQDRGAGLPALPRAAGRRRDPAHQQDRAAGGEHLDLRFRAHRRGDGARSRASRGAAAGSSTGRFRDRRSGIDRRHRAGAVLRRAGLHRLPGLGARALRARSRRSASTTASATAPSSTCGRASASA